MEYSSENALLSVIEKNSYRKSELSLLEIFYVLHCDS